MKLMSVLVIEDDSSLREALEDTLSHQQYSVVSAPTAEEGLKMLARDDFDAVITDVQLPEMNGYEFLTKIRERLPSIPVLMITAYGTIKDAVDAMREGATDYLVKPFGAELIINKLKQILVREVESPQELISKDTSMQKTLELAKQVAPTDVTVFISGESGTGKEVLARYLHNNSRRNNNPFVAINCAAIPETMLEALLFGYEKGAFTGALKSSPGKFELACGGTLLLDEITEMDMSLQAKLLRVLQEKEVERLGGQQAIQLDVRILATSNKDLRKEVAKGHFREDLYYRLNVFPLTFPPLRQRASDILPIARKLLSKHAHAINRIPPRLSSNAENILLSYNWPGNVRELENVMQRALVLNSGDVISTLNPDVDSPDIPSCNDQLSLSHDGLLDTQLKEQEYQMIISALKNEKGCRKTTAERLGISPRTLRYKLAQMRSAGFEMVN
jgi:two-component system, response regulator FlrC